MKKIQVNWPAWSDIINEKFLQLVDNRDRYLILYGGRGSSKSDFVAKRLIYRMLTEPYFRYILVRNNYNSIKESSYQTIKDIIYDLGLQNLFEFKLSPLEIICKNGNRIIARGCDNTNTLKSVKDPCGVWWEEDLPTESDFITVTTSIRTSKALFLQEIFSVNPETEGDHQYHWFWKRFFEGHDTLSFSDKVKVEIKPDVFVDLSYTCHHSVYSDNKWCTSQFVGFLESMKKSNPYYYQIFCLGRWGNKIIGGQMYKLFTIANNTAAVQYDETLPIWLGFDFNVLPGVSCSIWQASGKTLTLIDEIQSPPPRNTTKAVCAEFTRRYPGHRSGLFICGDPAGKHADTRSEKGYSDYSIIMGALSQYRPSERVQRLAPPVTMRCNFINTIFESNYQGVQIVIGSHCNKMISDLLYGQEDSTGGKLKEKIRDPSTGGTMEKYHHFSDSLDYVATVIFAGEFAQYQTGGRKGFAPMHGKSTFSNPFGQSLNQTIKPLSKNQYY
jgi:phage terminase large subunit